MMRPLTWPLIAIVTSLALAGCSKQQSDMRAISLRCEQLQQPLNIHAQHPHLSWMVEAGGHDRAQSAYRILVASSPELLERNEADLWDSGKRNTAQSNHVAFGGSSLPARTTAYWKVMLWDKNDVPGPWSATAHWRMGLTEADEWNAKWIGFDQALNDTTIQPKPWANGMKQKEPYRPLPCPMLRKQFHVEHLPAAAFVHASSFGIYTLYINGQRVGADYFTPGWTDYHQRVQYHTYDVSKLLQKGTNTMAVVLADGWFAGTLANRGRNNYGDQLRALIQLEYRSDSDQEWTIVASDSSWRANYGPWREADFQGGVTYDARLAQNGWMHADFNDSAWHPVIVSDTIQLPLDPYNTQPVRAVQYLAPKSITPTSEGSYIADFGQNFSGWLRIRVQGQRRDSIVIRYGEMLNQDGSLHTKNLRTARATDTYVLSSSDLETWEPNFTYHGFRYAEISGVRSEPAADDIHAAVVHSDLPITGAFQSASTMLNRLHQNIQWSLKSNFLELPTDCPQRDERLGWGGDAQLIAPTATYLLDVSSFLPRWLSSMRDAQYNDGGIPVTIPPVYTRTAAGWGDAAVIIPYHLFQAYNDTQVIEQNFDMMHRWIEYLDSNSTNGICTLSTFGDWQNLDCETPHALVATAYYKHCLDLLAEMAATIGKAQMAEHYTQRAMGIQRAFQDSFLLEAGQISGHTQTGYAMALGMDLLPDSLETQAVQHLVQLITANDSSLCTGIIGTRCVLPVLADHGHAALAYHLLEKETYPSWGYQINQGATTIWERWNGFTDSAGFYDDKTNSFNHFAMGSVGQWMYQYIAGIYPLNPGYQCIGISPHVGGSLDSVQAVYHSIRGPIGSKWKIIGDSLHMQVSIPPNTTAVVSIPSGSKHAIRISPKAARDMQSWTFNATTGCTEVQIGSGEYKFTAPFSH